MYTKSIFAVAAVSMLFGAAPSLAETVRVDCQYGPITLERLADGDCLSRIPVPTPRPNLKSLAIEIKGDRLAGKVYEYVETKNPVSGNMRTVRVVGTRYLPNNDGTFSLKQPSVLSTSLNTAFYSVAQLLGIGPAQADEKPAETAKLDEETLQIAVLEAQAENRVLTAHN